MPPIRADKEAFAGGTVVTPGVYDAELMGATKQISNGQKTKGASVLNVRYRVTDETGQTASVFDRIILVQNTLWKLKQLGTALGIDKSLFHDGVTFCFSDEVDDLDGDEQETAFVIDDMIRDHIGDTVRLDVGYEPETDDYAAKNTVKSVKPAAAYSFA